MRTWFAVMAVPIVTGAYSGRDRRHTHRRYSHRLKYDAQQHMAVLGCFGRRASMAAFRFAGAGYSS